MKTTYVVQRNGQVALPLELRKEYSSKTGDEIQFTKDINGWYLKKIEPDPMELLDQLGDLLKAKGITLEQLQSDGSKIRAGLVKEIYGLTA